MDTDIKRSRKQPTEAEDNGKPFPKKPKHECQAISNVDAPTDEADALTALTEAPSSDAPNSDALVVVPNSDAHVVAPSSDAPVQAPGSDALAELPSSDAPVEAPGSDAPVEAPGSDALAELPGSDAPVQAPSSDALAELPSSDGLVEAASSDALLALLGEAPSDDPLLPEAPASEESNEPWNNYTMLTPIDYEYYDALAQTTSSYESDDTGSSDTVPAPVGNRYDFDDWINGATSNAGGDPSEPPSGDDDEEGDDEEGDDEEDDDEVDDEGNSSSNESEAARSYDSFGNSIDDSINSDEPEDEPEGSPTQSEYEARARDASDAERYYNLSQDDPSSSEPSSSGNSGPTYY